MNFKNIICFSFLILIISIGMVSAEENKTHSYDELQIEIDNANSGDIIEIDGLYKCINDPQKIKKSLTFQGKNNATLDLSQKEFFISAKKVTFKDITFYNYNFIESESSNIFINCSFISKNSKSEFDSGTDDKFINCYFDDSRLSIGNGGSVSGTTFKNVKYTCALSVAGLNGHVSNCNFDNNKVAIDIENANKLLIENCMFSNNSFSPCSDWKTYYGVISWQSGEVYYSKNVRVNKGTLKNCTFISNNAKQGSIIFCDCNPYDDDGYDKPINSMDIVNIESCTFINNTASEAVINLKGNDKSSIQYCIFDNNNAKYICEANSLLNNNFWGYNIDNSLEFETMNFAYFKKYFYYTDMVTPKIWVNIKVSALNNTHAKLIFIKNNGDEIKMPEYSVLADGKSIKIGEIFECTDKNLKILNNKAKSVNRMNYIVQISKSSSNYYHSKTFTIKLTDSKSIPLKNMNILIKYSNGKTKKLKSDSKGTATYLMEDNIGTYSFTISTSSEDYVFKSNSNKNIKIIQAPSKVSVKKLTTTYNSGETLKIKLINSKTKKTIPYAKIKVKVFTGKKSKTYTVKTNEKGIAQFDTSKLKLGKHKTEIMSADNNLKLSVKKTTITVKKAKLDLTYPNNVNKNDDFKIIIKNKKTKKIISKVKFKVKVYNGKKFKTYNFKTTKKGVLNIKIKDLKKCSHKITINSLNSNYVLNSKIKIRIL